MNAISIISGAFCFFVAAMCLIVVIGTARTGIDYGREKDAGAALVCFVTAAIMAGIGIFLLILAVMLVGGTT